MNTKELPRKYAKRAYQVLTARFGVELVAAIFLFFYIFLSAETSYGSYCFTRYLMTRDGLT